MDTKIFMDKSEVPDNIALKNALVDKYDMWIEIRDYVLKQYPKAIEDWNYPGVKYGWSFRIKDKKRAIIYLLPLEKHFKVAFVYGEKATGEALSSNISDEIKNIIKSAPVYAEGRGFRIDINNDILKDIKILIDIKLAN
jgi:hypothetical protein